MSNYRGFGGNDLPDPQELLEKLRQYGKWIGLGILLLIAMAVSASSFFQVEPEEQAVILRFGRPVGEPLEPGLHFKIPFADTVLKIPVERNHRIEIGFRSDPGKVTAVSEKGFDPESLMLTGDLSLAHVRWSVLYKIKDIRHYLFNVKDPEETVKDVAMAVMRQVIGDYSLDEVLTGKYDEIASQAKVLTQKALDEVATGVEVTSVSIQKSEVPERAKEAFDKLNRSVANVRSEIIGAYARRKQIRGESEEQRQTVIGAAEGRQSKIVQNAEGEAQAYNAKLGQYRLAPEVTRLWMGLEGIGTLLEAAVEKTVVDDASGVLKVLPLRDAGAAPTFSLPVRPRPAPTQPEVTAPQGGAP